MDLTTLITGLKSQNLEAPVFVVAGIAMNNRIFQASIPEGVDSYRGDYSQLAIYFMPIPELLKKDSPKLMTARDFVQILEDCIDKKFIGYKGGNYWMDENTEVYVSQPGFCSYLLTHSFLAGQTFNFGQWMQRVYLGEKSYSIHSLIGERLNKLLRDQGHQDFILITVEEEEI